MEINIETAVRVFPVSHNNGNNSLCLQPQPSNNTLELANSQSVPVTYALPLNCCQSTLYATVITPLINYLLEGCDVSVVALGQSGSGKTYTLYGPGFHFASSESEHGIIPRFIRDVFARINACKDRTCSVHITWSQICGETVHDLLGSGTVECSDILEVFQLIQLGMSNTASKCAHTLFTVTLDQQWVVDSNVQHRISTASFTDLAGCEKILAYDNNGSLQAVPADSGMLALQQCINALSDPYNTHIPYNQSVLTTLLKDSFGGRAKTVLISCVSPLIEDFTDTVHTLHLALRSQTIKNFVTVNSYTTFQNNQDNFDIFGLQFAANQLFKLVVNAEELFQKLVSNSTLPKCELDQISQWLTLKQECEECLSENSEPHRSLDIIEEEEIEENYSSSSSSTTEEVLEEEIESTQDVVGKLSALMKSFRISTDNLVSKAYGDKSVVNGSTKAVNSSNEYHVKGARGRRGSIRSAEELPSSVSLEAKICEDSATDIDEKYGTDHPESNSGRILEEKKKLLKRISNSIADLQRTIQDKEKLMQQLTKNKNIKSNARQKLEQKREKLLSEFEAVTISLSQARGEKNEECEELCKTKLTDLKKKLSDAESLRTLTEENHQKLTEIESSLQTSKKQLEKLKKYKRKEEKRKRTYETQVKHEKRKTLAKTDSVQSVDRPNKAMVCYESESSEKTLVSIDGFTYVDLTKESIELFKHEIRNLRKTREYLLDQREKIDSKNKKILSEAEERKLLQYEEAVEAIDVAIEYKNEILCGRVPISVRIFEQQEEQSDKMLMHRLMKLTDMEMKILLHKYFQKVVDLRNVSKKLELQVVDFENENENLYYRVQNLRYTLQQVRLESESRIVALQQQHENKLYLIMKHLANDNEDGRVMSRMLERSKQTALAFQMAGTSKQVDKSSLIARFTRYALQDNLPRQLQIMTSAPQAKITRQKNKLFIQQTQK